MNKVAMTVIIILYIVGIALPPMIFNYSSMDGLRNLYTIIGTIFSSLIGFMGLMLGYFYYIDKMKKDAAKSKKETKNIQIKELIEELKDYDRIADDLLLKNYTTEIELRRARSFLIKQYDIIETLLENNEILFEFTKNELSYFSRVYSLIEKSESLMRIPIEEYREISFCGQRDEYNDAFRKVIKNCYNKIE